MQKRLHRLFAAVIIIMTFLSACEPIGVPEESETAVITTVTEPEVPPVEIYGMSFDTPPEKIVCLSPAITEIYYEIYQEDKLVGIGEYCDYPPEALTEKAHCGSAANPDFDTIIALAPDVLITQSPIANKDITRLENAGITLLNIPAVTDVLDIDRLYTNINLLCRGSSPEGVAASVALPGRDALLDDIKSADISIGRFVYYLSDDFVAAGSDTFPGNFFGQFGTNLCAGESQVVTDISGAQTIILPAYLSHMEETLTSGEITVSDSDGDETGSADTDGDETDSTDTEDNETGSADTEDDETVNTDQESDDTAGDESPSVRIIILSEEASKLLERPTSRVSNILSELT